MAISEVIVGGVTYDKTDRAKDTGRFNVGSFSGTFTYGDGSLSKSQQVRRFKADFDTIPKENINDLLSYGFLDFSYDGEEI